MGLGPLCGLPSVFVAPSAIRIARMICVLRQEKRCSHSRRGASEAAWNPRWGAWRVPKRRESDFGNQTRRQVSELRHSRQPAVNFSGQRPLAHRDDNPSALAKPLGWR